MKFKIQFTFNICSHVEKWKAKAAELKFWLKHTKTLFTVEAVETGCYSN